jgi:predicted deacylase
MEEILVSDFDPERIPRGSKQRVLLVIGKLPDGGQLVLPVLIVRGAAPGKCLLATGAIHGDEYEGPVAIQDFFSESDPQRMSGSFLGIPVLNGPAFEAGNRLGPWDQLDLARVFPGNPNGRPTERIAHAFHARLLSFADLYLDLHSGGIAYAIKALAGYQVRPGKVGEMQRRAAVAFGLDLVWGSAVLPGRSLSSAWERGKPAIYVELGGEGRCHRPNVELVRRGIKNLLALLGIIREAFPTERPRHFLETLEEGSGHLQSDHPSPVSGLFLAEVALWDRVKRGQPLGSIRQADGGILAEVPAARAGRVVFLRTFPRVTAGDCLAHVLRLED